MRLCAGEHSDWAAEYKSQNPSIPNGYSLVCATNEGLKASVEGYARNTFRFDTVMSTDDGNSSRDTQTQGQVPVASSFEMELVHSKLLAEARSGSFFSYVAGTACVLVERDLCRPRPRAVGVGAADAGSAPGIFISNHSASLPRKKGLSSSAAVCVLVATAFNQFYDLQLQLDDLMDIAYQARYAVSFLAASPRSNQHLTPVVVCMYACMH